MKMILARGRVIGNFLDKMADTCICMHACDINQCLFCYFAINLANILSYTVYVCIRHIILCVCDLQEYRVIFIT